MKDQEIKDPIEELIRQLARLPGVGVKSGARIAYHLLQGDKDKMLSLARALTEAAERISLCEVCRLPTKDKLCKFCSDPRRDEAVICVVERPQDVYAIEASNEFRGLYHVLHGRLDPISGITADKLAIKELLARLEGDKVKEIIVATNPTPEGDATALYLAKLIRPLEIMVSRIASGVPLGGELEFTDKVTLAKAISERKNLS